MTLTPQCAVCSGQNDLTGVVVGGEVLFVCEPHAAKLGDRTPTSFADLAQLFAQQAEEQDAAEERRKVAGDRRKGERRQFPPRPEGRRHNDGRRSDSD